MKFLPHNISHSASHFKNKLHHPLAIIIHDIILSSSKTSGDLPAELRKLLAGHKISPEQNSYCFARLEDVLFYYNKKIQNQMPSQKNVHQLSEITKALAGSKAVILTEYAGLTVTEQNILREEAEKTNSSFIVTKNNLLRLALKEKSKELADTLGSFLNGPTAVLFGTDAVAAAKILSKFAEDHEKLVIKTGIMDDKVITLADISALSKLPSYEQLLGQLMAQLQAPAQALVRQLNAPMQNLVYGLNAIKAKIA